MYVARLSGCDAAEPKEKRTHLQSRAHFMQDGKTNHGKLLELEIQSFDGGEPVAAKCSSNSPSERNFESV
jgi:hypothetical protein